MILDAALQLIDEPESFLAEGQGYLLYDRAVEAGDLLIVLRYIRSPQVIVA